MTELVSESHLNESQFSQDLQLLEQIDQTGDAQDCQKLLLNLKVQRFDLQELQKIQKILEQLDEAKRVELVGQFEEVQMLLPPVACRVCEALLLNSRYDQQNQHYVERLVFLAVAALNYYCQTSRCSQAYAEFFKCNLQHFQLQKFTLADFNLPCLRMFSLREAVSFSPIQYAIPPEEHSKGRDFRTDYLLLKLGIRPQAAKRRFGLFNSKQQKQLLKQLQLLDKRVFFNCYAPNFVHKTGHWEVSAGDFAYMCLARPALICKSLSQVRQEMDSAPLLAKIKQHFARTVELYDKCTPFTKRNFAIARLSQFQQQL